MIKGIAKLLIALNGNIKKSQIASGFAWGLFLGLVPAGNVFWVVVFILSFFFTHNQGAKVFGLAFVKLLMLIPGPGGIGIIPGLLDSVGWSILNHDNLIPIFTAMYNMPFVPFTKFNNTLVMGGTVIGAILWIPSFFIFMALIPLYRNKLAPKIMNSKLVKSILKFPLISLIDKAMHDL